MIATMTTVSRPSDEVLGAIDWALGLVERELMKNESPPADLVEQLRAAQTWLMAVNHKIHLDDVANDR